MHDFTAYNEQQRETKRLRTAMYLFLGAVLGAAAIIGYYDLKNTYQKDAQSISQPGEQREGELEKIISEPRSTTQKK